MVSVFGPQNQEVARGRDEAFADALDGPPVLTAREEPHAVMTGHQPLTYTGEIFVMHMSMSRTECDARLKGAIVDDSVCCRWWSRADETACRRARRRVDGLDRDQRAAMMHDVMEHAAHFFGRPTRQQALVVVTQKHFIARLRHGRLQLGAILRP